MHSSQSYGAVLEYPSPAESAGQVLATRLNTKNDEPEWSLATRIAFRFFAVYLFLFAVANRAIPGAGYLSERFEALQHKIVPWLGRHILHLSYKITVFPNGSGDTTFNYVEMLTLLAVAAAATAVWSVLDRKRTNYTHLHRWIRLLFRITLGFMMIEYGSAKAIPMQMPAPYLSTLFETYSMSRPPMGLLWTSIGASAPWQTSSSGNKNLLPAAMRLFVPWLSTLGALICIGALSNVFMLNMSYDVPVKLFSFHLLVMALFLVAPDLRSLADLFIFRRKARLITNVPLFRRNWLTRTAVVLQIVAGVCLSTTALYQVYKYVHTPPDKVPFSGIWSVEEFAADGNVLPPLLTDKTRWQRIIFEMPGVLSVQSMDGSFEYYRLNVDEAQKSFTLKKGRRDPNWQTQLRYQDPQTGPLTLEGTFEGHKINAKLNHVDTPKFLPYHPVSSIPLDQ